MCAHWKCSVVDISKRREEDPAEQNRWVNAVCMQLMAGGKLKLSRKAVLLEDGFAPRTPSPSPSSRANPTSPKTPTTPAGAAPEVGRVYKCALFIIV